jgi:hypothetical protein
VIEMKPVTRLRPLAKNARTDSKKRIRQIGRQKFGFNNAVLTSDDLDIIARSGRSRLVAGPCKASRAEFISQEERND